MDEHPQMTAFWQAYLENLPPAEQPPAERYADWYFGDNPALADELAALVLAGVKTATCTLLLEMGARARRCHRSASGRSSPASTASHWGSSRRPPLRCCLSIRSQPISLMPRGR